MKKLVLATIVVFFSGYYFEIQGQTTHPKLNQVELIKQFVGKFQSRMGTDTLIIWDLKPFGNGYELTYTFSSKGKIYKDVRDLWGYDEKAETWVVFSINNINNYTIYYQKFISETELTCDRAYILTKGEKQESFLLVVESIDKFVGYNTLNGNKRYIRTYNRVK